MSPKIPRDVSGQQLVKLFAKRGYIISRQKGSHIRVTRVTNTGEDHLTIPNHNPIKLGTLNSILSDAAEQLGVDKEELLRNL